MIIQSTRQNLTVLSAFLESYLLLQLLKWYDTIENTYSK